MKQKLTFLMVVLTWVLLFNLSWSACPEAPLDLGFCDTLHVFPWPETDTCYTYCRYWGSCDTFCVNNPGEPFPRFLHVPLLVTHDSNTYWWEAGQKWVQDSIVDITVPLHWDRTNPSAYCSLSSYWNSTKTNPNDWRFPRSIWRHFHPSELDSNRLAWLAGQNFEDWTYAFEFTSDSLGTLPPHVRLEAITASPGCRRWWEGERTLFATLTFVVADTMHIWMDTLWRPASCYSLSFTRYYSTNYMPRHNLPLCIWVCPVYITTPAEGQSWCIGKTEDIIWQTECLEGPGVKIQYSTDGGTNWLTIVDSTQNDGTYTWPIPATPSDSCVVKISDAEDADHYGKSSLFTIFLAGDVNADGMVNIADIVYLINYSFIHGPAPVPCEAGDVNLDGVVNTADIVYLLNYRFSNGPPPGC